jgi:hypothetical protein
LELPLRLAPKAVFELVWSRLRVLPPDLDLYACLRTVRAPHLCFLIYRLSLGARSSLTSERAENFQPLEALRSCHSMNGSGVPPRHH